MVKWAGARAPIPQYRILMSLLSSSVSIISFRRQVLQIAFVMTPPPLGRFQSAPQRDVCRLDSGFAMGAHRCWVARRSAFEAGPFGALSCQILSPRLSLSLPHRRAAGGPPLAGKFRQGFVLRVFAAGKRFEAEGGRQEV